MLNLQSNQIVKLGGGGYLASFALAALLAFSSSSAFGQVEIDGVSKGNAYSNPGKVGTADVTNGAWLYNVNNANIGTANVSDTGSVIENWGNANIDEANAHNNGLINNRDNAIIGTANLYGGTIENVGSAHIDTVNNRGGLMLNRENAHISTLNQYSGYGGTSNMSMENAHIDTANVYGGDLYNRQNAIIGSANIYGGRLFNDNNYGNSSIGTANVYGGELYNLNTINTANVYGGVIQNLAGTIDVLNLYDNGRISIEYSSNIGVANVNSGFLSNGSDATIDIVNLLGGTVTNAGSIDHLTYTDGNYFGSRTGSIDTLTLAGDARGMNWGNVDTLDFADNEAGIVSITGTASGYSGITATNVDFAFGNIWLDLSALAIGPEEYWASAFFDAFGYDEGFYLADLFGANSFSGVEDLNSFEVAWENDSFWILNGGVLGKGWDINYNTGFVSWMKSSGSDLGDGDGGDGDGGNPTPEPATLLILGLGAIGAGLAARRRMNQG